MGRGGKKKSGGGGGGGDDLKTEEVLQAVLLADSFTQSFRPMSLDLPKVSSLLFTACDLSTPLCEGAYATGKCSHD